MNDAVLVAVERILDAHGPAGLTTNRVAEVAGVSIGSVYQYYPNKHALVGAVQERVLNDLFEAMDVVLTSSRERTLPAIAQHIAAAMLGVYHARRPIYRWLIELRSQAAYQERFRVQVDRFVARVATFLEQRGLACDARVTAFVLVSAVEGIANAVAARPGANVAAIAGGAVAALSVLLAALEVPSIRTRTSC